MGICPSCKHPVSTRYGCGPCGVKSKDLITLKESEAQVKEAFRQWEADNEQDEQHIFE